MNEAWRGVLSFVANAGTVAFANSYGNETQLGPTFACTAALPYGFLFEAELVVIT